MRTRAARFIEKAGRGIKLSPDEVKQLRLLVNYVESNPGEVDEALDRANLASAALPPGHTATPLAKDSAILDSNAVIALAKEASERSPGETSSAEALKGERDLRMTDVVAAGEPEPGRPGRPPDASKLGLSRIAITVKRDSDEYRRVLDVLVRYNVGHEGGHKDRAIAADLFFAVTEPGVTPRFLTADDGLILGMLRIAGYADADTISGGDLYPRFKEGFRVTLFGRTIIVVPLPRPEHAAGSPAGRSEGAAVGPV